MTDADKLLDSFLDHTRREIESSGEYRMASAVWFNRVESKTVLEAMDLHAEQIVQRCVNTIDSDTCSFLVFGLDMSSRPGQGLEFDDFVLVFEWREDRPGTLKEQLRIGVINYRKDPLLIRPVDWDNRYWTDHAFNLVKHCVPLRVRVSRGKGAIE